MVYGEDDLNRTIDPEDKKSGHEDSPESNLVSMSCEFTVYSSLVRVCL